MSESKLRKIGKYDVLDILGRGGMGVIYKAVDPAIGRLVAIKMITGAFSEDPDLLKRFYREAQSTGTLQHPNVVTVYELGDLDGTPYLVMEFLDGEGLDKVITERRSMSLVEKLAIGVQVCHGLGYAHQKNVIHRDIKPANVVVQRNGAIKIVDFGIARIGNDRLTKPGQVVGSIHYMSPEQINAIPVDARTDIFSTGVLLYELITYSLPFQGRDTFTTLMKILNQEAPPLDSMVPGLPQELNGIIQQALAKDRDLRYASIDDLAFDLNRVLDQLKEGIISGYLTAAENFMKASEWAKAKEQIALIFRIDRQHTKANMLNREITAAIQRQELQSQIREHRAHAEQAFAQHRYDEALAELDQALALRKTDPTIVRYSDSVQAARAKAVRLADALHRANASHDAGDLDEAKASVDEALAIDPENPEAKALQAIVRRELEDRARQKQIDTYVEQGRKELSARRFTAAIEVLKKAEQLDPTGSKIHELINLAVTSQEQERRRRELAQACSEVEEALNRDDYNAACAKADEALEKFPGDRALLKLKTLAEKQKELGERRTFVEEQIKGSRRLLDQRKSQDAQQLLQTALERYPGEPALSSQLSVVNDIIAREREEERKSQVLHKAREALRKREFAKAIATLQEAHREFESGDIDDLLQFARDEAAAEARQKRIIEIKEEAERLVNAGEFEAAISLLEKGMAEVPDEELQIRLVDARHTAEEFERRLKEAVTTVGRMLRGRRASDAVKYLEGMPPWFSREPVFREALERAREQEEMLEAFKATQESVRTALDNSDFDAAFHAMNDSPTICGEMPELLELRQEIESIRQATANTEIEKAVHDARLVLLVRSYDAALKVLEDGGALLAYTSPELRAQFESLKKDALEGKEKQERELKQRLAATGGLDQMATRLMGSETANVEDTHWSSAATATPIPAELTRLEAGILRERDLIKLRDLFARCEAASVTDCEEIEQQVESISEMYPDDSEFQVVVSEVLDRLAAIEKKAHVGAAVVEGQPPEEPERAETIVAGQTAPEEPVETVALPEITPEPEIPAPAEPQAVGAQTTVDPVMAEMVGLAATELMPPVETEPVPPSEPEVVPSAESAVEVVPEAPAIEPQETKVLPGREAKRPEKRGKKKRKELKTVVVPPQVPAVSSGPVQSPQKSVRVPVEIPAAPLKPESEPSPWKRYAVIVAGLAAAVLFVVVFRAVFLKTPSSTLGPKATVSSVPSAVAVRISSSPMGANIHVNGQACTTPDCNLRLTPGNYEIEAELAGYESTRQPLQVKNGQEGLGVLVALTPVTTASKAPKPETPPTASVAPPRQAVLEFVGAPPATMVKVDGVEVGRTGSSGGLTVDVKPGTHRVELLRDGFNPVRFSRRIAADKTVRIGPKEMVFVPVAGKNPQSEQPAPVVATKTEPAVNTVKTPPPPPPPDPAEAAWARISGTRDQNLLADFAKRFPASPHATEATRRIAQLQEEAAAAELAADRSEILQTLKRYSKAYRDRNANAVASLWPALNKQELKKIQDSFKAASSIQMDLHPLKDPDISGDRAKLVCSRSLQYTFPQGVQKPRQDTVTVQLRKENGLWVIDKIE